MEPQSLWPLWLLHYPVPLYGYVGGYLGGYMGGFGSHWGLLSH